MDKVYIVYSCSWSKNLDYGYNEVDETLLKIFNSEEKALRYIQELFKQLLDGNSEHFCGCGDIHSEEIKEYVVREGEEYRVCGDKYEWYSLKYISYDVE